jgi:hypothetical protein
MEPQLNQDKASLKGLALDLTEPLLKPFGGAELCGKQGS